MSSIAGIVNHQYAPVSHSDLARMAAQLSIHGPDASGQWHSPACGLASNLRYITSEDSYEQQPLQQRHLTLVADVRLNNREDLSTKLGRESPQHSPTPDSELILSAFQKWGSDCVAHLLGAFAFAIWDESEQRLFLARDHTGEKTVFYHDSGQSFAFATMPKGLFALPWIERELNEEKLAEFLTLNHSNHATSFYKNVYRLPPGHCLTVRSQTVTLRKYWELDLAQRTVLESDDAYVEQGREILKTCIHDSLRSTSPVGAMMSGGLDSSTVACMAGKLLQSEGESLPTFTEVPRPGTKSDNEDWYADETPYIEAICAQNPSLVPQFIRGLQKSIFEGADKRLAILEAPHRNPFNQLWLEQICHTANAQGINVLLTGQSGNMSLSYDGLWRLPSLFKSLRWHQLVRELDGLAKNSGKSMASILKAKVLAPLCPSAVRKVRAILEKKPPEWSNYSLINPCFAKALELSGFRSRPAIKDSRIARSLWRDSIDFMGECNQLALSTTGVELRDPLGDVRFVQWALSIPESQFIANGNTRLLAKRIAKNLLPDLVIHNSTRGQQAADWAYLFEENLEEIKQEIRESRTSAACQEYLDLDEMDRLVSRWPGPKKANQLEYRFKLCRGLTFAKFLRSLE